LSQDYLILLGVVVACLAAIAMLWSRLLAETGRSKLIDSQTTELAELRQHLERLEDEQQFVTQFIHEFPHLTAELQSQRKLRRVPVILLQMVRRTFQPEQALILIRRKSTLAEPERDQRMVVAAVTPSDSAYKPGMEIAIGEGALGLVAESEEVLDRNDLEPYLSPGAEGLVGFPVDLAAGMMQDGRSMGVVALSRPGKAQARAKAILRLIAQMGAFTLNNMATFVEMKSAADVDPLTGIFNKRVLSYRLGRLMMEAEKSDGQVAVFLFDIDHFKNYNDVNGHVAGDHLLRLLSHLVADNIRADDVFGRFGGEEFLLILPERSLEEASRLAETLRREIEGYQFPYGEWQPLGRLTISGGVAAFPDNARNAADLLRAADAALYDAKKAGRNEVREAGEDGAVTSAARS
jgi:diguanylate cyclase (GGDEF)-like protein